MAEEIRNPLMGLAETPSMTGQSAWMTGFSRSWAFVALIVVGAACKESTDERPVAQRASAPDARVLSAEPLGPVRAGEGIVEYAVYFLPKPKVPATAAAKAVLAKHPTLHPVVEVAHDMPRPAVLVLSPSIDTYAPPDAGMIELFGVGLSDGERAALPDSPEVLVLTFISDAEESAAVNREAMAVIEEIATRTGGVIWDEPSRQAFSALAWRARVAQASAEPPDVGGVIASHAYQPEPQSLTRVVSLGMDKLALPDLVLEDVPQSFSNADDLLRVVAQLLVEGAVPNAQGRLSVELGAIRNASARERFRAFAGPNPRAAEIDLHVTTTQEGDGRNRLWEIGFPGTGALQERQAAVLAAVFDENDEIVGAADDDVELLAASKRAREALMALKPAVTKGLAERERLLVKAPFATDDGNQEYMWIEVSRWQGAKLRGILLDDPFDVSALEAGATVEVDEASVFDYELVHADGTKEGGETSRILQLRAP